MTALAALAGGMVAGGLILLAIALRGLPPRPPSPQAGRRLRLRVTLALGGALLAGLATRWPVGTLLAGVLGWAWPALFGTTRAHRQAIARVEAIATWTEQLRGMLASAAGIEQAVTATVPVAPDAIRAEVGALAGRLRTGEPLTGALGPLADAIGDETGDLVVGVLLLAADPTQRAGGLGEQLDALAAATREKAAMRQRVLAARARVHSTTRTITLITLAVIALLALVNPGFLEPYRSVAGQLALLGIGTLFGLAFLLLARLGRLQAPQRFLASQPGTGTVTGVGWR